MAATGRGAAGCRARRAGLGTQAADEAYFTAQDAAEDDPGLSASAMQHFGEARLGTALLTASDAELAEAASETIYEALAATAEPSAGAQALLLILT